MNRMIVVILLIVVAMLYAQRSPRWIYEALIRPVLSKIVNYAIYYFRRFILFQSIQEAKREHYPDFAKTERRNRLQKTLTNIAVVNKNRNKYSETFIDLKIKGLKNAGYYVHQLYGGYFPTSEVHENHLLSNNKIVLKIIELWELFWNKGENYYLKIAFRNYLKDNDVKIVLAEFGTCGVEVFDECRKSGFPLIVTFRGYDIHHKKIFEANGERYKEMFTYCSKVICVSNDILNKLNSLYHLQEKLRYIPSLIDLNLFAYSDHSINPPVFLYVGRFAETKSPHLVILSFHETLKQIPDARLVMVGRDGGGELFEACLILIKALNIEDKVELKGVLPPQGVYEEMKKARVFIQHSLTTPINGDKEGTPVSVREAMACGLPVVATNHAGISETIIHNQTGVLVDEYDYLSMAEEMTRVCKDNELVFSLGKNAAESIHENELIKNNIKILAAEIEKYRLR
ncbi:MAG: D-inositol-3-phosphate glycosyltransferase [Bacteroidia bacterium]|nr:D-inositol-3-phosphate glycosyltransferase [Bacteroidia bacterium]